jgi:hypothetical protein
MGVGLCGHIGKIGLSLANKPKKVTDHPHAPRGNSKAPFEGPLGERIFAAISSGSATAPGSRPFTRI